MQKKRKFNIFLGSTRLKIAFQLLRLRDNSCSLLAGWMCHNKQSNLHCHIRHPPRVPQPLLYSLLPFGLPPFLLLASYSLKLKCNIFNFFLSDLHIVSYKSYFQIDITDIQTNLSFQDVQFSYKKKVLEVGDKPVKNGDKKEVNIVEKVNEKLNDSKNRYCR